MPFFFLALFIFVSSKAEAQATTAPAPKSVPAAAPAPAMVSVTRVVGEAGPRIVTSREVRINEAVSDAIRRTGSVSRRVLKVDDPTFASQVLRVLDEWTVYLEAVEIGSKTVDKNDVARLTATVTEAWKSSPDWNVLEPAPSEIREIIERKLMAEGLERLKSDASLVNVTDAEALQYFKKNRLRFGNLPFDNFKDNIKSALAKTQTERRMTEWRSVLRRKYRVRNFVGA